jgi:hypothetical protein
MSDERGTWAYTADSQVFVPERNFHYTKIPNGWRTVGLRGYKFVRGVFDLEGECQGWVEIPASLPEDPTAHEHRGLELLGIDKRLSD